MELSTRLSEQLALLATRPDPDDPGLVADLSALASTLGEAVSGYAGLRLTVVQNDCPVQVTAMHEPAAGQEVVTSLRMPLPGGAGAGEAGGELLVWSTVPGSLVDLAADVGYVLRNLGDGLDPPAAGVALDAGLPQPGTGSGVEGLDQLATVHRATGVLIGQGHDPGSVLDELRRRAAEDGLSAYAWAGRLLRGLA